MRTTSVPTVEQLAADEALRLMAGVPVGRVVFTEGALPAIRPVHFLFDGADVVFRIVADQRLAAALHNTVVAFEADEYDAADGTGWTATVTGHATRVDNVAEITRLDGLLPRSWGPEAVLFRVEAQIVAGRRVGLQAWLGGDDGEPVDSRSPGIRGVRKPGLPGDPRSGW